MLAYDNWPGQPAWKHETMKRLPFSFVIPVFGEADTVQPLLDSLYRQFLGDEFEIIVVDGEPSSSTLQAIGHPDVIKLTSPPGRGIQLNNGARTASGRMLIFLHADTQLPANALEEVGRILSDERYVAGAFTLRFKSRRWGMKIVNVTASWRYHLTRYPYGDQAIFMTKSYFDHIGGYADIPIMEDLDLMRRIKQRGDKICISPAAVLTSARRWETEGVIYSTLRTWILASLFCVGVPADSLINYYRRQTSIQ